MKKILKSLSLLTLLITAFSCTHEATITTQPGHISFSIEKKDIAGGRVSGNTSSLLISIQDSEGKSIYENKKLSLIAFGQDFITEDLEIETGSYSVTKFLVLDDKDQISYATPLEGSEKAVFVDDALPIGFTVVPLTTSNLKPQVLAVSSQDKAQAFGYVGFGFEIVKAKKLLSEEFFMYDTNDPASQNGYVGSHKKVYKYKNDKLVQVDGYDYNILTHTYYSPGYKFEEYHYNTEGKLIEKIQFIGESGLRWVETYEYLNSNTTKVTRYETNSNNFKSPEDWWIMEKTASSLNIKYYQLKNELYAEVNSEIDAKGNISSVTRNPSYSTGKIRFSYDSSPNPYYFPELSGNYLFVNTYFSKNNVVETTSDSNTKSTNIIEYDADGYPIKITTPNSRKLFTYQ